MSSQRAVAFVVGGLAVLSGLAGCGNAHQQVPTAHESFTSATPKASNTLDPSASAALSGYKASWAAVDEAGHAGDYQLPALAEHMTGQVLELVTQNLFLYQENGIVSRGAFVLHPQVKTEDLAASPPTVTISDCVDGRNDLLYYKSTGKPIDSDPGGFRADTTVMSDIGGVWKATSSDVGADGTCTPE